MATSDSKGNPTSEQRQLVASKTTRPDWSVLLGQTTITQMATAAAPLLDSELFEASAERDAINRVLVAISPDDSEVLYTYDEGGNLQVVEVKHRGSSTAQTVVGDITYNARGQRETIVKGDVLSPTTTTTYTYDPETYRLTNLTTVRGSDNADLQALSYTYDPVGNITDISDAAQQTVYFQNTVVSAANSYTYDAAYRLIEATGREHSSQGTSQRTDVQVAIGPQPMTSDPSAMRRYTQKYSYDAVGNILTMQHIPAVGSGWTRYYQYATDGNRLLKTSAPGDPQNGPYTHSYTYDAHGSMTAMPHIAAMVWNHDDELLQATVGTEEVYFQYAAGMRSRKYVEKSGTTTEERIYLGPFELYRKRVNGTLDLERETLHISDGTGRICMIETKTVANGSAVQNPTGVWRHQLGNHLGSAATEVDASGAIISYEEYHPYGTSAYRATNASIDVSAKRYRYTGMERDEETGLAYHTARYYAPWLGRWTAADPIGLADGLNRWAYSRSNPTVFSDLRGTRTSEPGLLQRVGQFIKDPIGETEKKIDSVRRKIEPQTPPDPDTPFTQVEQLQSQTQGIMELPTTVAVGTAAAGEVIAAEVADGGPLNLLAHFAQGTEYEPVFNNQITDEAEDIALIFYFMVGLSAMGEAAIVAEESEVLLGAVEGGAPLAGEVVADLRVAASLESGAEVFIAEPEALLPSGLTVEEVGLAGCQSCGANAIAISRNLQGVGIHAEAVPEVEIGLTEVDEILGVLGPELQLTEIASAGTFEELAVTLSQNPESVGIITFDTSATSSATTASSQRIHHVVNFLVDVQGNVVIIDGTGEMASAELSSLQSLRAYYSL